MLLKKLMDKLFSYMQYIIFLWFNEFGLDFYLQALLPVAQFGKVKVKESKKYLTLIGKDGKPFKISKKFIEWLVGFSDAEGNFHLSLKSQTPDGKLFSGVQLYFQIGLHMDHIKTLRFIQSNLKCGSISPDLEDNRYNFAVCDLYSIVNIILPIFEYFKLNSSKINIYNLFKQAVVILLAKEHLKKDLTGKKKLVEIRSAIANLVENKQAGIVNRITVNWLIGFIEGDVTFSTSGSSIRMKFENTLVETQLFRAIINFFGLNPNHHKLEFPKLRERGFNESPVVVLALTHIDILFKYLIPLLLSGN
jgi:hypothetical protein